MWAHFEMYLHESTSKEEVNVLGKIFYETKVRGKSQEK
jgi:hypothetical protein